MAKVSGTAGRAGTTEALTSVGRLPTLPANVTPQVTTEELPKGFQSIYLGETVGPAGQARFRRIVEANRNLKVGDLVRVRWGYGSGFRAEGDGRIVKVFPGSVQVKLDADVPSPYRTGGMTGGWPKGYTLKGIPRWMGNNWNYWHSVEPLNR